MGAHCSTGTKKQVATPSEAKPGKRRVAFADDVHIPGNDGRCLGDEQQEKLQEESPSVSIIGTTTSDDSFSQLEQEDQDERRKEMFERRRAKQSLGRHLQAPEDYANRPAMRANAQKRSTINLQAQLLESGIDEGLDHSRTALASNRCSILNVFSVMGICPAPEDKDKMKSAWENQDYEEPPTPRHSPRSFNRQRGR